MSNEVILSVKNFSISYNTKYFQMNNLRDFFINTIQNPLSLFITESDRLIVLKKISFDVQKGERLGILGANGVGKTSLCRYLAQIIQSDSIKVNGESRAIFETGMNIYPELTGKENAILITELMFTNLSRAEKNAIVEESIVFSDLQNFANVALKTYSKGMRARLFLSLLTSKTSDLIILDEILGGTDQYFTEKINTRIQNLILNSGAAIVVSHNLDEISVLCNRVIVLSDKSLVFDGPVDKGIEFYRNTLR